MSNVSDPRFQGIDFERSYLLGVIYDDESLTLEMEFNLTEAHPAYQAPSPDEEGCFRAGYVRFADIGDLQIDKAPAQDGGTVDYSIVHSVKGDGERFEFSTGWGEIKVSAKSVRLALD
ncbi:MAG TPA: hypothetical protein VEB68_12205 [Croceibacterium sp.]|nr:hypothetical protein [Propylenella sp.]HYD25548.1 hypothetical protein [Croceibacterium sp.]